MANPTTNYSFVLPTSSDLVTDLPADFDVALQGVDTRLKALQPGTTLGDLAYSSATANTNTRLPIGTSGQILAVSGGGVPAWSAAVSPTVDYTLLNSGGTALTGAATITVSGISGKNNLFVSVAAASSANAESYFSLRFNSDSGSNYDQAFIYTLNGAGSAYESELRTTRAELGKIGDPASDIMYAYVNIFGANATGVKPYQFNSYTGAAQGRSYVTTGFYKGTSAITSVSILSSSGNFDAGTIFVYGA